MSHNEKFLFSAARVGFIIMFVGGTLLGLSMVFLFIGTSILRLFGICCVVGGTLFGIGGAVIFGFFGILLYPEKP